MRYYELKEIMVCFPGCFINPNMELVFSEKGNVFIALEDYFDKFDVAIRIITYCSRDVCKGQPYASDRNNRKWRNELRNRFNTYLKQDLSEEDWELIYQELGNGVNPRLANMFVCSNFDMKLLREREK